MKGKGFEEMQNEVIERIGILEYLKSTLYIITGKNPRIQDNTLKITVDVIIPQLFFSLSKMSIDYNLDVEIKRSGKGLTVLLTEK